MKSKATIPPIIGFERNNLPQIKISFSHPSNMTLINAPITTLKTPVAPKAKKIEPSFRFMKLYFRFLDK